MVRRDQAGPQGLAQGAAPGDQAEPAAHARQQPAEVDPVVPRGVAAGPGGYLVVGREGTGGSSIVTFTAMVRRLLKDHPEIHTGERWTVVMTSAVH